MSGYKKEITKSETEDERREIVAGKKKKNIYKTNKKERRWLGKKNIEQNKSEEKFMCILFYI